MNPDQNATVSRTHTETGMVIADGTGGPVVVFRPSEGDALRVAAAMVDQFDGRVSLAVAHHRPGTVSIQVSYTSGDCQPALDLSRWEGIRIVAAELGRPISVDEHTAGLAVLSLSVEIGGVAVEFWTRLKSPQVIAKIQGSAAVDG